MSPPLAAADSIATTHDCFGPGLNSRHYSWQYTHDAWAPLPKSLCRPDRFEDRYRLRATPCPVCLQVFPDAFLPPPPSPPLNKNTSNIAFRNSNLI